MSGTSLDGVDIAYCIFLNENKKWSYKIECAETISYDAFWRNTLGSLEKSTAFDFVKIHKQYGHFLGKSISEFVKKYNISPDFIASHGHTIFHQPEKKITFQLGDGAAIVSEINVPVVCDFRSSDVALGGQGAPLVPIGDEFLFPDYDYCLNLGGFANISFKENKKRIAFDICPVNIVLNNIAAACGKEYDKNGDIASCGKMNSDLLNKLNGLDFYKNPFPKSLGKEWVTENFNPLVDEFSISSEDKLHTICEHISFQISNIVNQKKKDKMLVTGGGAYNSFLISRLKEKCKVEIVIPEKKIIDFKEALIFAFLGVLRMTNHANCLRSVTGAIKDNIGGAVYLG